jgi:hypothetical protein
MATISKIAMLVAGAHFVALTAPRAAFAQAKPETTDTPVATIPPASTTAGSPVWVHIQGSEVATLEQDTAGDRRHWLTVCSAPCDQAVPLGFGYRISGDGIRNSRVFSLHARGGDRETLEVDEGSKSGFVLGIVAASVGAFVMFVGLFVVLVNSVTDSLAGGGTSDGSGLELGWALSGIGLAGVVGGAVAIATNARTGVTQGGAASSPAAWLPSSKAARGSSGFKGVLGDAFENAGRRAGMDRALPPMVGVPLFGTSF